MKYGIVTIVVALTVSGKKPLGEIQGAFSFIPLRDSGCIAVAPDSPTALDLCGGISIANAACLNSGNIGTHCKTPCPGAACSVTPHASTVGI
jgi:hypothetical protein